MARLLERLDSIIKHAIAVILLLVSSDVFFRKANQRLTTSGLTSDSQKSTCACSGSALGSLYAAT